ncbi:MAG: triple tyrosine motif-containing protein [Haliscomenobacter sp.]|uniref:sensor histidine kinase n=1 Tax=Haliscomenobacter sp. TaxID=2717303 RepID=UPI0029A2BC97|nr:triple tyrosine motif-containing protein [Haliscomenobacter sp.]MDX2072706.1 triple tyrosine motif-containing protein [Haliscomenobacter sp.]
MIYNKSTLVLFAFLLCIGVYSQETLSKINWLTQEEGLLESTNAFIHKDKMGFVWISSLDGLHRFDGRNIKWYQSDTLNPRNVYGNNIQSPFFENSRGDLWFVTEDAINCYLRNKGYFEHYFIRRNQVRGQREQYYAFHLEQDRYLWVRADNFLYRFDTHYPNDSHKIQALHYFEGVRCTVQCMPNGKVRRVMACHWDLKPGMEVIDYKPDYTIQNQQLWFDGKKQESLNIRQAHTIDGVIWLVSNRGLIACKGPQAQNYQIFPISKDDREGIRACVSWKDHRLLVLTQEKGEIRFFTPQTGLYSPAMEVERLSNDIPNQKTKDIYLFGDELWGAAYGQGVFFAQISPPHIKHPLQINKFPPTSINQIWQDGDNGMWCISENGLVRIFDERLQIYRQAHFPYYAQFFQDVTNQIWCYSNEGLAKVENKGLNLQPVLASTGAWLIYDVENLGLDRLLLATNEGMQVFDKKLKKIVHSFNREPANVLQPFAKDIFLAGTNTQLLLLDSRSRSGVIRKLETGFVSGIVDVPKDSTIWISTLNGLRKINRFSFKEDTTFKQPSELKHAIKSMVLDDKGVLWLSGNRGIYSYSTTEGTLRHFTRKDGLFSSEFNFKGLVLDQRGQIWAGGNNGVDVINARLIDAPAPVPTLVISGLKIHDKYWFGGTSIDNTKSIRLPYHQNTLKFEMSALDYRDPAHNQFKVYLAGYDQVWSDLGTQNFITYANLPYGHYRFLFTASNAQGGWQKYPKELKINIVRPYWRTWWFYTIIALLVCLLVFELFRYRTLQRKKQEHIRQQIARDLHDEMGSTLSSISILSDAMQRKHPNDGMLGSIQIISERTREVMDTMSDIVWSVNPHNDEMGVVIQKMRTFAAETLEAKDVILHFNAEQTLEGLQLSMEYRKDFYLFFKETINNVAKYAQASEVWVNIQKVGVLIELRVKDDGKGFIFDKIKPGNGLRNLQERATRLRGKMHLESNIGKGTSVDLSFPITS